MTNVLQRAFVQSYTAFSSQIHMLQALQTLDISSCTYIKPSQLHHLGRLCHLTQLLACDLHLAVRGAAPHNMHSLNMELYEGLGKLTQLEVR